MKQYNTDVVSDGREYMECAACGYKGIGWVQFITDGTVDGYCDICAHRSAQESLWKEPFYV